MKHLRLVKILAIETSCDETAASVLKGNINAAHPKYEILSSVVKSQIKLHKKTGGVVPEVAAREHMKNIQPIVAKALTDAKLTLQELDYISVTSGPGLITALIVGVEYAKALAVGLGSPLIPINHMAGHLYSAFMSGKKVKFPLLAIIVSGGHTLLILMTDYAKYKVIGGTVDDAIGEAFDKVARLLNLPYPGGPEISKMASKGNYDYNLPRPMLKENNFNFSFSGLKTATLYLVQKLQRESKTGKLSLQQKQDIAFSFENAATDVIVQKVKKVAAKYKVKTVTLSGGVAANRKLRSELQIYTEQNKIEYSVPEMQWCTDNAQMIAVAAYFHLLNKKTIPKIETIKSNPTWQL